MSSKKESGAHSRASKKSAKASGRLRQLEVEGSLRQLANKSESSINTSSASSSGYLSHSQQVGSNGDTFGQHPSYQQHDTCVEANGHPSQLTRTQLYQLWRLRNPARQPPMVPMMIDDEQEDDDRRAYEFAGEHLIDEESKLDNDFHRALLLHQQGLRLSQEERRRRTHKVSQISHAFGQEEEEGAADGDETDYEQSFAARSFGVDSAAEANFHYSHGGATNNRPLRGHQSSLGQSHFHANHRQTYLIQQPSYQHQHHTFSYHNHQPPEWYQYKQHSYAPSLAKSPSERHLSGKAHSNFAPEAANVSSQQLLLAGEQQQQHQHLRKHLTEEAGQVISAKAKKMQQAVGVGSRHLAASSAADGKPAGSKRRAPTPNKRKVSPNGSGPKKELVISCCGKLAKLLLLASNLLFWLAGMALGAWGILALVDDHKYNLSQLLVFEPATRMSLFQLLSWSFITLGCATILVGFCGCSALLKNNRWILGLSAPNHKQYIFLILAIFALDLATGLLAIIFQERLVANVRLRLGNKLRSEYGVQASFTAAIDYIQTKYECCGLEGHFDYDQSLWRLQRLGGFEATVARTCCHLRNTFDDQAHINPRPVNESMCQSPDVRFHQSYRYRRGCLDDLERLVRLKIWNFTIGCAAVGAIILLSLFFATCFCRSIPRPSSRKTSGEHEEKSQPNQRYHHHHHHHHVKQQVSNISSQLAN